MRGPNWIYGTQDKSGPGTIVQGLGVYSKANYVQVAWDYAPSTFYEYRAGNGFFDVQLYAGKFKHLTSTMHFLLFFDPLLIVVPVLIYSCVISRPARTYTQDCSVRLSAILGPGMAVHLFSGQ